MGDAVPGLVARGQHGFGAEVVRFSPRQSDVLLVVGTINDKMAPVLK